MQATAKQQKFTGIGTSIESVLIDSDTVIRIHVTVILSMDIKTKYIKT